MEINEYIEAAKRTCAKLDLPLHNIHMVLGMVTEAGELADVFKKNMAYNKDIDWVNVKEELGDFMWYLANFCATNNIDLEEVLETNIKKLIARYPEKYTDYHANNRDLKLERKILET